MGFQGSDGKPLLQSRDDHTEDRCWSPIMVYSTHSFHRAMFQPYRKQHSTVEGIDQVTNDTSPKPHALFSFQIKPYNVKLSSTPL
jgi:hypothetical protein